MNEFVAADLFLIINNGITQSDLAAIRDHVRKAVPRIRELGNWPAHIDAERSLVSRVPTMLDQAPGFDAGIACALDLIPRDKQKLAATLHAVYTEAAVEQVRREVVEMEPDSETCWWLAASSVCLEGAVYADVFERQLKAFDHLIKSPVLRLTTAIKTFAEMGKNFRLVDGIPFVIKDGGLQGAYVSGHDWGVQYVEDYGLFFIGTFRPSLGLESFPFSDRKDEQSRPMSGPVHGSKQFVKVSSFKELEAATRFVRAHLGSPKK
ncbi:hypothetical protein IT407_01225 [Candidatus Uhrbacteria bacterium]|nr:hypothetical protein [Candidatus Uhrbacteria bacterium]